MSNKRSMTFQYGDRELWLGVSNLLTAPVDIIVSPTNRDLLLERDLAGEIALGAGEQMQKDCQQLIKVHGVLESGIAVYTDAGQLPFKAVIHAVSPTMGEGDEQKKIENAVSRSLQLCEINEWCSIAFPPIGSGIFNVPVEVTAQALFRSIISFWDARHECTLEKIMICLSEDKLQPFFNAFRNESSEPAFQDSTTVADDSEENIGYIELDEKDTEKTIDDETDKWFI